MIVLEQSSSPDCRVMSADRRCDSQSLGIQARMQVLDDHHGDGCEVGALHG